MSPSEPFLDSNYSFVGTPSSHVLELSMHPVCRVPLTWDVLLEKAEVSDNSLSFSSRAELAHNYSSISSWHDCILSLNRENNLYKKKHFDISRIACYCAKRTQRSEWKHDSQPTGFSSEHIEMRLLSLVSFKEFIVGESRWTSPLVSS